MTHSKQVSNKLLAVQHLQGIEKRIDHPLKVELSQELVT